MDPIVAATLNRIGFFFQIASFFFAAPDLLGEQRLKHIEKMFEWSAKLLRAILYLAGGIVAFAILYAVVLLTLSLLQDTSKFLSTNMVFWIAVPLNCLTLFLVLTFMLLVTIPRSWMIRFSRLYTLKTGFDKHFTRTIELTVNLVNYTLFGYLFARLDKFGEVLADDSNRRRRYLIYAAIAFFSGTVLQFISTFTA